ncbi:hypothetical protein PanWU01x14_188980, partial [Parasponia andersonii]
MGIQGRSLKQGLGLTQIDLLHALWNTPRETLHKPSQKHNGHVRPQPRPNAPSPPRGEANEAQVGLLQVTAVIGQVAVRVEAQRVIPDGGVAAEAQAAEQDAAALGDEVASDCAIGNGDVGEIEGRNRVEADSFSCAGYDVREVRDVGLLEEPLLTAYYRIHFLRCSSE